MILAVEVVKTTRAPLAPSQLRAVLAAAAAVPEVAARLPEAAAMTVRIGGDRLLRQLNRRFAGEDHATDVLSFADGTDGYLGDLAISWPAVERQAAEHGHPPAAEAALLSVHGLLHLLGWDHGTPAEEAAMWELTGRCLAAAGVNLAGGRLARSR